MPKIVTENKILLRRKEVYLSDVELSFFEADAKKNGYTTSKAYLEAVLRAFKAAKGHRATGSNNINLTLNTPS